MIWKWIGAISDALLIILAVTMIAIGFSSCKTQTMIEYRDRVKTDTITEYRDRVDSVYQAHYVYLTGDTIHQVDTIYKYRLKYVDKLQTQIEVVRDSIPYEVQVVKEVRKRSKYDRFVSIGFWILLSLLLIRIIFLVRKAVWYLEE